MKPTRDDNLRMAALDMAVRCSGSAIENAENTTKRAAAFYSFLSAKSAPRKKKQR